MKTKICKCGHDKGWHDLENPDICTYEDCPCKKFKPQCNHCGCPTCCVCKKPKNHSPQDKIYGEKSARIAPVSIANKTEDTLSSKIKKARSCNIRDKVIPQYDIKNFIKNLKEETKRMKLKVFDKEIDKLAGEELLE